MRLWRYLREISAGAKVGDQFRFWAIVIVLSPVIVAVYLGMWSEGWLEERDD